MIVSRADARANGFRTYATGKPCPRGHVSERRVHNGECIECGRARARHQAKDTPKELKRKRDSNYRKRNCTAINERRRLKYSECPRVEWRVNATAKWNASDSGKRYKRLWTKHNRDRLNSKSREWKEANVDKVKAGKAQYYRNNPLVARAEFHRRRARTLGAEGSFTRQDFERICALQRHRCACCRRKRKLTVDHIVPLARGGSNRPSNIQGLCRSCNARKHALDPIEFMQKMGALL